MLYFFFFFSSRRRHTRFDCDWSSDVCSSDLLALHEAGDRHPAGEPEHKDDERRAGAPQGREQQQQHDSRQGECEIRERQQHGPYRDRKSTRLNSSHSQISYAVFCLKKKKSWTTPSPGPSSSTASCRRSPVSSPTSTGRSWPPASR